MATFRLYTYIEDNIKNYKPEEFRNLVKDSVSVSFNTCEFVYDEENDCFHPIKKKGFSSYELNQLYNFGELRTSIIVKTRKIDLNHKIITFREVPDWPKTIDDLEKAGIVKTKESMSFYSENGRKFYFVEDGEDTALDVDYLGTRLSEWDGSSQRVIDEWKKIDAL